MNPDKAPGNRAPRQPSFHALLLARPGGPNSFSLVSFDAATGRLEWALRHHQGDPGHQQDGRDEGMGSPVEAA